MNMQTNAIEIFSRTKNKSTSTHLTDMHTTVPYGISAKTDSLHNFVVIFKPLLTDQYCSCTYTAICTTSITTTEQTVAAAALEAGATHAVYMLYIDIYIQYIQRQTENHLDCRRPLILYTANDQTHGV